MGVEGQFSVICDATFTYKDMKYIVEVDNTQKMSINKKKLEKYKKLVDLGFFKSPPAFIWVTTTERKKNKIQQLCDEYRLRCRVFTMFEIDIDC